MGKKPWLNEYFDNKYRTGKFETHDVPVIESEGAFDESVKGVAGIIHVVCSLSRDPAPVR